MSSDALSQSKPTRRRRSYTPEFKQSVIAEILETRQSISSVSLRIGVNDNIVRRWMTDHLKATGAYQAPPQFVPILCDDSDTNFSGPASTAINAPVAMPFPFEFWTLCHRNHRSSLDATSQQS